MTDLSNVQTALKVASTDAWNPQTVGALRAFQQGHGIPPTGLPDPDTLATLGVYDPVAGSPSSFRRHLAGGPSPGTFFRDIGGAMNQVPRFLWLTLGIGFVGLAYWQYRKARPATAAPKKRGRRRRRRR